MKRSLGHRRSICIERIPFQIEAAAQLMDQFTATALENFDPRCLSPAPGGYVCVLGTWWYHLAFARAHAFSLLATTALVGIVISRVPDILDGQSAYQHSHYDLIWF